LFWLLIAGLGRLSFSICNILDGHFRVGVFKDSFCQTFYFSIYTAILVVVFYIFHPVEFLPSDLMPWTILAGLCLALHGIPYLSALRSSDTSTVVSLFTLGRILVPILAVFIVNESLSWNELCGFVITIFGALWHAYQPKNSRINKDLILKMTLAGMMIALFSVCSKRLFNDVPILTALFHIYFFDAIFGLSLILIPRFRPNIILTLKESKRIFIPYSIAVFFVLMGHTLSFYAISLTKVTYVAMTAQFQALLTLLISYLGRGLGFLKHNESFNKKDVIQKLVGFFIMAVGMGVALLV
jgi:drug/metabolite transporter (DMT)-like permease